MSIENPGAYQEAKNRMREKQEQEYNVIEKKREDFELGKEKIRKTKKLDVFELKRKIETGQSLHLLKSDIQWALDRGEISVDTYHEVLSSIDSVKEVSSLPEELRIDPSKLPLAGLPLTQFFEHRKLGENIFVDMAGFFYGFVVQWGAIFIILFWKIFMDLLLLPRDIYKAIQSL